MALAYGRKKSRGKWDMLVVLLVLSLSLGVGLAACGTLGTTMVTQTHGNITATAYISPPAQNGSVNASLTLTATIPGANGAPTETVTLHCAGTLTPSPTPGWRELSIYDMSAYYVTHETQYYPYKNSLSGPVPSLGGIAANKYFLFSEGGVCMQGSGKKKDGKYIGCTTNTFAKIS